MTASVNNDTLAELILALVLLGLIRWLTTSTAVTTRHLVRTGLMIGLEFVKDRQSKAPAEALRDQIIQNAFHRGLLLLGCGKSTIRISPPLMVNRDEVYEAFEIIDEAITVGEKEYGFVAA